LEKTTDPTAEIDFLRWQPWQRWNVDLRLQALAQEDDFLGRGRRRPLRKAAQETAEPESCVVGTTTQANLVEQQLTVRWLPKDRQPTQTDARQRRIESARRFDDANLSLRMNGA
jgi:hypothetical protein